MIVLLAGESVTFAQLYSPVYEPEIRLYPMHSTFFAYFDTDVSISFESRMYSSTFYTCDHHRLGTVAQISPYPQQFLFRSIALGSMTSRTIIVGVFGVVPMVLTALMVLAATQDHLPRNMRMM